MNNKIPGAPSGGVKLAKRGEYLFKEGDKISSLILLQSGSANVCLARPKKNIDMFPVGPSQVLGEQSLTGNSTHGFSLMATADVKYMEVPVEVARSQLDSSSQFVKILVKSLIDRLKSVFNEVKSTRMERDSVPCPEDQVARIFGAIYHTALKKAKSEDEKNRQALSVDWTLFKQYAQRIFGESPRRIEQATNLLCKLKLVSYTMGKSIDDPEGPDEIQKITFFDMGLIESFFEFYQYYYFKGSSSAMLKYDESSYNLVRAFLKLVEPLEKDRFGAVSIDYSKVIEYFKTEVGLNITSAHFTNLELKGLFAKRQPRTDGSVVLSFELKEWQSVHKIWQILHEIDKWNEKGFVALTEEETKAKKKGTGSACPQCGAEIQAAFKFCQECGAKLELLQKTG